MKSTTVVPGRMYLVSGFGIEDLVIASTPFAAIKRFLSQVNQ